MNKLIKRQIKNCENRIKELEEIRKKKLLNDFLTDSEIYGIICDYNCKIDYLYRQAGHT